MPEVNTTGLALTEQIQDVAGGLIVHTHEADIAGLTLVASAQSSFVEHMLHYRDCLTLFSREAIITLVNALTSTTQRKDSPCLK